MENLPFMIPIAVLFALVVGGAIGYFTVQPMLKLITKLGRIKNGPWFTSLAAGSASANPYLKTWIAEHGLLALAKSETLYFHAYVDDTDQRLLGDSNYRIEGKAPHARWWSITAYGEDDFLILNDQWRYSYSCTELNVNPGERFAIHISRTPREGYWIPTGEAKTLSLSLRLYNPAPVYYESPKTVELPHIVKEGL
jgi:hypothetical protein